MDGTIIISAYNHATGETNVIKTEYRTKFHRKSIVETVAQKYSDCSLEISITPNTGRHTIRSIRIESLKGYSFKKAVVALFSPSTAYDFKFIDRKEYAKCVEMNKNVADIWRFE